MAFRSFRRSRFAAVALVAMGLALGASFLVLADAHGAPGVPGSSELRTSQPVPESVPCSVCLIRAQLRGSDLPGTAPSAEPERLVETLPPRLEAAGVPELGFSLSARGPPFLLPTRS